MKKHRIKLSESQVNRVIRESVKRVLKETMDWSDYDKAVKIQADADNAALDDETLEFMNTPNATQDYSKFPRISAQRNHNYDSLANGSQRIQQYKALKPERDRQKEIEEKERFDRELLSNISKNDFKKAVEVFFGFEDFCRDAEDKLSFSIADIDYNEDMEVCATIRFNGTTKGDVYDVEMKYTPSYVHVKHEDRFGFKTFEGVLELPSRGLKYIKNSNDDLGNAELEQDELLYGHD